MRLPPPPLQPCAPKLDADETEGQESRLCHVHAYRLLCVRDYVNRQFAGPGADGGS